MSLFFIVRYARRLRSRYDRRALRMMEERTRLQLQHQALVKLATSETKKRNLISSIRELLETAAHTLDVDRASLWIFEDSCSRIRCLDFYEKHSHAHSSGFELTAQSAPNYFAALQTSRVITLHNLANSEFSDELAYLIERGVTSSIDSPVRLDGTIAAVVCLRHVGPARRWSTDEQNFAASIADMAAIAFQSDKQKTIQAELEQKSFAIESSMDGMAILDANHTYVYLNHSHATLYGYDDPSELLGKSWRVLYDTEELARFERELMPQFQRDGRLQAEARGRKKDGSIFPQEISLTALEDGGLICVIRDITVRKLAERNAEQMALFATLHPSPVLRFDHSGTIISANPAALEIFGLPQASGVDLKSIILGARDLDLQRCIEEGALLSCSSRIGEKYFHFLFRGVPDLMFGHVYGTDITDLKRAHQRLIDSKKFLRRVVDSDPNLIYVKDSQGRFTLANQATADLYGTTVNEILWKTDADLLKNAREIEAFRKSEQEVISTLEDRIVAEETFTDAQGHSTLLRTVRRPLRLTPQGDVHVLGVGMNITETKKLQEDLLQSQKMEAIGQLAGGIAHDFNNLLTGILGCTGLLKMKGERDPDVNQSAEMIESAASRAGQLTQKLLGFARKGKHQNIPVDIHQTIEETVSLLRRTIEKNIAISQIMQAPQAYILGDPTQIQQIILNLAINARDAMSVETGGTNGGELSIFTRLVPASALGGRQAELEVENFLEISVCDTGCGIPEELREKIFEPFFTTKATGRGTGMGLAMVYGIVQNHEGFLKVESALGHGTTFRVYLPSLDAQAVSSIIQPPQKTISGRGQVLVVDDHNVVRSVTAKMLQSLGYGVVTARDGVEAHEYFREHWTDIDVVILDMIMPHMGARECLPLLKGINPNVRAILSTGYVNNNAVQEIMNEGMCGFIQKPYQLAQLSAVVAQVLKPDDGPRETSKSSSAELRA
ncbi:MAG: PAS domain S-box protein [Deltaproteobacteria bacterium]|nr:PAS domain S-box protein [Deltaproteobacteria bacterium]